VTLAALSGHVDVLRALLVKWPEADRDEAFSMAFARNDGACLRVLGERSFVWISPVFLLLQSLPMEEVERVCARYVLPVEALRVLAMGELIGLGVSRKVCCDVVPSRAMW
jgi:hypothetical protein